MTDTHAFTIRPFESSDGSGWVECRLLSFVATAYFDDVKPHPTTFENPTIRLVAVSDSTIAGLLDIEIDGRLATIDSIAVRPPFQGSGIATALLEQAIRKLPSGVVTLDAWTRDDEAANSWYRANSFRAQQHYLHVYKSPDVLADETLPEPSGLHIVGAFMHASLEDEEEMRRRFKRVHVCRRYVRSLSTQSVDAAEIG